METESAEIDFRSLEDELYDNEITQILTQPSTTEKSTLNTPELPADVDRLVDHLSEELKQAAEKLFEFEPPGSSDREASSDEEGSHNGQIFTEAQPSSTEVENGKTESDLNDFSSDVDSENAKRMGQLSVELKEAAEKLFAVDPLGSSERDFSSSDQETSSSESDLESDDNSDLFSLNNDDHSQSKSEKSEDSDEQSESANSFSRPNSPCSLRSEIRSEINDPVDNGEKSPVISGGAKWEATNNCKELNHTEDAEKEESVKKMDSDLADKLDGNEADPSSNNSEANHTENVNLELNSGNECMLLITDVRSENEDFHPRRDGAVERTEDPDNPNPADSSTPNLEDDFHNHRGSWEASKSLAYSNALINVEGNETDLVVENVYSLSEERNKKEISDNGDDVCENNITARSLRIRKAKPDVKENTETVCVKKNRKMKKFKGKRSVEGNIRGIIRKKDNGDGIEFEEGFGEHYSSIEDEGSDGGACRGDDVNGGLDVADVDKMEAFTIREDGQYKCNYCCCTLSTKARFRFHMRRLHEKKYRCRYCEKKFLKSQDLACHVKTRHSEAMKYKVCKSGRVKSFEKESSSRHYRKRKVKNCTLTLSENNGQLTYACGYCGQVFEKQQALACHIRNKHVLPDNSGKIVYNKRGKFGRRKKGSALLTPKSEEQVRGNESDINNRPPMKKARKGFESRSTPNDIQLEDVTEDHRPRRGTKASRAAETGLDKIAKLQKDYNIHISHQVFRCGYCPKWYFKKTDLSNHIQKHMHSPEDKEKIELEENIEKSETENMEEPEAVEMSTSIGKAGSKGKKREQRGKTREQQGRQPVFCKYCTSKFKSVENLKVHVVRHVGELYKDETKDNKFECGFCGHTFQSVTCTNINPVMSHLFDHYSPQNRDIDPYNLLECQYCGLPFLSSKQLQLHENEHQRFLMTKRSKKLKKRQKEKCTSTEDNKVACEKTKEERSLESKEKKSPESKAEISAESLSADNPVPFTCGMCSSRFPTSQYLLHHMTLHMKGRYVFRVELDKSKSTQQSPVKFLVKQPNQPPRSQMLKPIVSEKNVVVNQLSNTEQHISPLVQDRIQAMLRQSEHLRSHNSKNDSVTPNSASSLTSKPQILKKSVSRTSTAEQNGNINGNVPEKTDILMLHTKSVKIDNPQIASKRRSLVSIIANQPSQIKESVPLCNYSIPATLTDSESNASATSTAKKTDPEMGRNKRKQTFHVSEIKEDFHCAEDFLDSSTTSTETADLDVSESGNDDSKRQSLVSIIANQPSQIKENVPLCNYSIPATLTESESNASATSTAKKTDPEMGRNKRKQTFHVSEIKEDFHCAEDLLDSSTTSTETADLGVSKSGNDDTESVKTKPNDESRYREASSASTESSSDSASDFERDWKSRYRKKNNGRKRRKRLFKRLSSTKAHPKTEKNNSKSVRDNSRIWRRKIDFANGNWFECSLCLYKCTTEHDYLVHVKTHEQVNMEERELVKCKICQREFMSKWHLQIHKAQHRSNEYQCSYCGMDFSTSSAIVSHIEKVHQGMADSR